MRFNFFAIGSGFIFQTAFLSVRGRELGRCPITNLFEVFIFVAWSVALIYMLVGPAYRLSLMGAFTAPLVLLLQGFALITPIDARYPVNVPANSWLEFHASISLVAYGAFALACIAGVMYLLQERQLKAKRPGRVYYRLPSLETLDRFTFRTLTLGFPFLTAGLLLGVLWANAAWGSVFAFDPMALLSVAMWVVYAATLSGRALGAWRGRRAAYFAIAGFCTLLLTLGVGVLIQGRHGL